MTTDADQRCEKVCQLSDAGETVEAICEATGLKFGRVYDILRKHRPNRPRQPRKRTSRLPEMICGLADHGIKPPRIAVLLKITPAYVYAVLAKRKVA